MAAPNHITVSGAPEGFDARLLLKEMEKGVPVLHVARDDKRLAAMQAALAFFAPEVPVFVFPAWDCLPYDRVSPRRDIMAARADVLAMVPQGRLGEAILITLGALHDGARGKAHALTGKSFLQLDVPMMPLVRGVIMRRTESGSRLWVTGSISANTGVIACQDSAWAVAINV